MRKRGEGFEEGMSSRHHICSECGDEWECGGCGTKNIERPCDACLLSAYILLKEKSNKMMAVVEAAKHLIGRDNIGKVVDTKLNWEDISISACFHGSALTRLVKAIEKLEKE